MYQDQQDNEGGALASGQEDDTGVPRRTAERPDSASPKQADTKPETAALSNEAPAPKPGRAGRRRFLLLVGAVLALGLAGYYGHYWWTVGRFYVSTDDAYVGAHGAVLSPKVAGYIADIEVVDNAPLKAGQVIARIDPGDFELAVRSAKDQVAAQQATIDRIGSQIEAQAAAVDQAKAQLTSAKAAQTRAKLELRRQRDLAAKKVGSRQTLEQADAAFRQSVAAVQSANAGIAAANANVAVLHAQKVEAQRTLAQTRTALAKAERDLSFTVIRAPFDGVIGNRAMQVGDYVQPGQRLASLMPLDAIYVDANFKETQLAGIKPGQPVDISVDALPDKTIEGRVASLAPASGSVFSLLPPDNATGNFTKIVQRLPVRIVLPVDVVRQEVLRPGMSVTASVNTKPGAEGRKQQMNDTRVEGVVK